MEEYALFKRHVKDIHAAAGIVIAKQQLTKVSWPELVLTDAGEEGTKLEFSHPAIIWNAPFRASSRGIAKRAIVMDGCFYFKNGYFDKGGASLEVYSTSRSADGCKLELLEAMHFDIEPNMQQSAFHPMFHVQFGKNHRWDVVALTARVANFTKLGSEKIEIDRDRNMPTRDVRIPTPQMDYLSMLVMVVADYFCEKNSTHEVRSGFKNLLQRVMSSRNAARVGRQSQSLEKRWSDASVDKPFAAAHWYEESCR
jgi:hypothetical protein